MELFEPKNSPNIYCRSVVLLKIACQSCIQEFLVEMHDSLFSDRFYPKKLHYGDPPIHGYKPVLIDTPDNVAAAQLALDLVEYGEPVSSREDPGQRLLFTGGRYLTPLMTIKETKPKSIISGDDILSLVKAVQGEH